MNVAIIKYNAGNIKSVYHALKRLGIEAVLTDDPARIQAADKVIFPGVGEAGTTMAYLKQRGLDQLIRSLRQPVLGICLGQQLMCAHSLEGNVDCLGIFDQPVKKFEFNPMDRDKKVPHMGWNSIADLHTPLFDGISEGAFVYYVHSFRPDLCDDTICRTEHGGEFSGALAHGNFYGTQFHPEKSGSIGEIILRNFIEKAL